MSMPMNDFAFEVFSLLFFFIPSSIPTYVQ
jgi:hypothetical protein